ncbi:MAG: CRISPR-associated endonuclease Cas2, partial [Desulfurella sp.]
KTRNKLARFLFEYGIRTQYSVFEVEVKPSQYNKFVTLLEHKVKYKTDKIFIYALDKNDIKKIKRIGNYEKTLILDYFV